MIGTKVSNVKVRYGREGQAATDQALSHLAYLNLTFSPPSPFHSFGLGRNVVPHSQKVTPGRSAFLCDGAADVVAAVAAVVAHFLICRTDPQNDSLDLTRPDCFERA